MTTQIFIIEDNDIVRESLAEFITAVGDYEVCGLAASAEQALEALDSHDVDLVVVDLSLPGMDGVELVEFIRTRWPEMPCVICSGHREATYVRRALEAGSKGYILKGQPHELSKAIPVILNGERYLSDKLHLPE
jgi:DNA-binding NarL/FixJ family response regulator